LKSGFARVGTEGIKREKGSVGERKGFRQIDSFSGGGGHHTQSHFQPKKRGGGGGRNEKGERLKKGGRAVGNIANAKKTLGSNCFSERQEQKKARKREESQ